MLFLANHTTGHTTATAADPALVQSLAQVPADVFDTVGAGSASNPPTSISGAPLTQDGKPQLLYVGGEFCPYCAAERWAMVLALSRFGTFSDLKTTRSSSTDVFPNTPTFSFFGSNYQSDYLSFVPVEQYSNQQLAGGYAKLQDLTADQEQIVKSYDPGGIPFLDFGGKYALSGASYSPSLLGGMDWQTIASKLTQTSSAQSQAVVGTANVLTAAICRMTDGQPGNVCNSAGVQQAASAIK